MSKFISRRFVNNGRHRGNGAGTHAPHTNLTYVNNDVLGELRKTIPLGEQCTFILTPEHFFEISGKSDQISHVVTIYERRSMSADGIALYSASS